MVQMRGSTASAKRSKPNNPNEREHTVSTYEFYMATIEWFKNCNSICPKAKEFDRKAIEQLKIKAETGLC